MEELSKQGWHTQTVNGTSLPRGIYLLVSWETDCLGVL